MSAMRRTMSRQPDDLERILSDWAPVELVADRLAGRRTFLVGTGSSWHAANQGAYLLRLAGLEAWPVQAADCALYGPSPTPSDALIVLSHRGTKRYAALVLAQARETGVPHVLVAGQGAPGADLETVEQEESSAFTASHLGALARLTQLAVVLGAKLPDLGSVPEAVARSLEAPTLFVTPPARGLQFIGAGPNQWTAVEGALKVRETARIFAAGHSVEEFLHGPSVAIGGDDGVVVLEGGGPAETRIAEVAVAAEAVGARVYRVADRSLAEPLSIFPLTVAVQRIALECAEALGTDPDRFGFDVPGREEAWGAIEL